MTIKWFEDKKMDVKECTHDLADMDTAAHLDGVCPICANDRLTASEARIKELEALLLQAQDEAYERAAGLCDKYFTHMYGGGECEYDVDLAQAIRSLKSKGDGR